MKVETTPIPYKSRLKEGFMLPFFVIVALVAFPLCGVVGLGGVILITLAWTVLQLALPHFSALRDFHKVELTESEVILTGDSVNKPITIHLPIQETRISIKSEGSMRSEVKYYLRLHYAGKKYFVNRRFNWSYAPLIEFIVQFKQLKDEKLDVDEKHLLDLMKKRSEGWTGVDILRGEKR